MTSEEAVMPDENSRDDDVEHRIEIVFFDREDAEKLYDFLEEHEAVMMSGGTLSLVSYPAVHGVTLSDKDAEIKKLEALYRDETHHLRTALACRNSEIARLISTQASRVVEAARKVQSERYSENELLEMWNALDQLDVALTEYDFPSSSEPVSRKTVHPPKLRPELDELIVKARAIYEAMSPEQRYAIDKVQAESWVRGDIGIDRGPDARRNVALRPDHVESSDYASVEAERAPKPDTIQAVSEGKGPPGWGIGHMEEAKRKLDYAAHQAAAMGGQPSIGPGSAWEQTRVVLIDDGIGIRLNVYPAGSPLQLVVELLPERAVGLCADLSAAAARHLARRRAQ